MRYIYWDIALICGHIYEVAGIYMSFQENQLLLESGFRKNQMYSSYFMCALNSNYGGKVMLTRNGRNSTLWSCGSVGFIIIEHNVNKRNVNKRPLIYLKRTQNSP